jgi:hypothetical protein
MLRPRIRHRREEASISVVIDRQNKSDFACRPHFPGPCAPALAGLQGFRQPSEQEGLAPEVPPRQPDLNQVHRHEGAICVVPLLLFAGARPGIFAQGSTPRRRRFAFFDHERGA